MTNAMCKYVSGMAAIVLLAGTGLGLSTGSANAVVYCRAVGVPHGCVARPGRAAVVVHPAVAGPVVYCKRVGYPKGCVAR